MAFEQLKIPEAEYRRPGRQPLSSDINLSGGYDFWTLHEPRGMSAFWEHLNHSFSSPNPRVIHSSYEAGVNNDSGYRYMMYGVFMSNSRYMPPGPNIPEP